MWFDLSDAALECVLLFSWAQGCVCRGISHLKRTVVQEIQCVCEEWQQWHHRVGHHGIASNSPRLTNRSGNRAGAQRFWTFTSSLSHTLAHSLFPCVSLSHLFMSYALAIYASDLFRHSHMCEFRLSNKWEKRGGMQDKGSRTGFETWSDVI